MKMFSGMLRRETSVNLDQTAQQHPRRQSVIFKQYKVEMGQGIIATNGTEACRQYRSLISSFSVRHTHVFLDLITLTAWSEEYKLWNIFPARILLLNKDIDSF
jgi:hypothetical protein